MISPLISLEHITVAIGGTTILSEISWALNAEEHWAVLGDNGAGKSTLLRTIRGELWPVPGNGKRFYYLNNEAQESPIGVRQRVAFVSPERQDTYSMNNWDLTGEEVVYSGFFDTPWLHEQPAEDQVTAAGNVIRLLGLESMRRKRLLEMSEGQARGILLARALVSRPAVLILDEACSGLDGPSRRRFLHIVNQIAESGTSILFATHRVDELPTVISHALLLHSGRIVSQGRRKEVVASLLAALPQRGIDAAPPHSRASKGGSARHKVLVAVRNADVYLGGRHVLKGVTWAMQRGEHWAVVGRNGSGKTTLLKLIMGEVHPAWGGQIRRFGRRRGVSIWEIRRRIGYVSSDLQGNYDRQSTGEEVVLSGFFWSVGLYREATAAQHLTVMNWLMFLGLKDLAERNVSELSYGQMRRLLIARAMVNSPDLLLLDEPCSGLDARARAEMLALLERLAGTGTSLVLVTHHLEDLIRAVTHAVIMDEGSIFSAGPLAAVLATPGVRRLFHHADSLTENN